MPRQQARRRRRRDRNFVAIPFSASLTLGALTDDNVVSGSPITFGEDIFVISCDVNVTTRDGTAGEGPIEVGVAHGDLTNAEIEEALQAELTDPDDIIARERARRPVRRAGQILGTSSVDAANLLNGGQVKRVPCRFSIGDGHTFKLWAAARGGNLTAGCVAEWSGTIYGRWQR